MMYLSEIFVLQCDCEYGLFICIGSLFSLFLLSWQPATTDSYGGNASKQLAV